jgi:hypothetical protein
LSEHASETQPRALHEMQQRQRGSGIKYENSKCGVTVMAHREL